MNRLGSAVVHEICTNQVVVTLQACVKELLENALDASARRVSVRLVEQGLELLEVSDDGLGIAAKDFHRVAQRHTTSKIGSYEDLSSRDFKSFGFRGEALSAISAMGDLTIATCRQGQEAALLCYDRHGALASRAPVARAPGTTVSVRELFRRLPVRHKEFQRNAKGQVALAVKLIEAYAIAQPEVRFSVVAERLKGPQAGRSTLLSTSGTAGSWREAAAAVLGDAALQGTLPLRAEAQGWRAEGLISGAAAGRRARDAQLFFVNGRPIEAPKRVAKLLNDTYHQYNSRAWPLVILAFTAPQGMVDVNVTPDKKTVFMHEEEQLAGALHLAVTELFSAPALVAPLAEPRAPHTPAARALGDSQETPEKGVACQAASQGSPTWSRPLKRRRGNLDLDVEMAELGVEVYVPEEGIASEESAVKLEAVEPSNLPDTGDALVVEEWLPETEVQVSELTQEAMLPAEAAEMKVQVSEVTQEAMLPAEAAEMKVQVSEVTQEAMLPAEAAEMKVQVSELTQEAMLPAEAAEMKAVIPPEAPRVTAGGVVLPAPTARVPATACFEAKVTLEGLRSGQRRRQQAVSEASEAPALEIPRSFSLSSLKAGASVAELAQAMERGFSFEKSCFGRLRVVGQFNLGFILGALQDGGVQRLFLIDQHAADEKFRFEALNRESRIARQPLVSPHRLELSPAQEQLVEAHLEVFRLNGFDLKRHEGRPPGRRLSVTALPSCQGLVFNEKDIHDLLYKLEEAEGGSQVLGEGLLDLDGHRALCSSSLPRPPKVWSLLASKACRHAIMIGKALRLPEMRRVLRNLGTLRQPWNCPHGRPTMRHLVDSDRARRTPSRAVRLR